MKNCGIKSENWLKSITNNPDNYDKKYMEIKFNLDGDLPLNYRLELYIVIIVVRSIFSQGTKYPLKLS